MKIRPAWKFARYKHSSLFGRASCDKEKNIFNINTKRKIFKTNFKYNYISICKLAYFVIVNIFLWSTKHSSLEID
jgi:hypothetical protein